MIGSGAETSTITFYGNKGESKKKIQLSRHSNNELRLIL